MQIDFFGDLTCPWCHLGWRRLRTALSQRQIVPESVIRWRPYQLAADLPVTGMDRNDYLLRKFASPDRVREIQQTVEMALRTDGLHVNLNRIRVMSNTYLGHRLILLAEQHGQADAFLNALFVAYFVNGLDIGDPLHLHEIAKLIKLPEELVIKELNARAPHSAISQAEEEAKTIGLRAVPYCVFDGQTAIAGAHDPIAFLPLIDLCILAPSDSLKTAQT